MAIAITRLSGGGGKRPVRSGTADDILCVFGTVSFDTSYATGGFALTPANIGLKEILLFEGDGAVSGAAGPASAVWPKYDYATSKILLFGGGALAYMDKELPAYTSLVGWTIRFVAYGRK